MEANCNGREENMTLSFRGDINSISKKSKGVIKGQGGKRWSISSFK